MGQMATLARARKWAQVLGGLLGLSLTGLGEAVWAYCPAELPERIEAIVERADIGPARLGIVVEAEPGQALYRRDADKLFLPASVMKLLTTAAALERLGPDFSVRTSVYAQATENGHRLYVVGRGDPTFDSQRLAALAQQVAAGGITRGTLLAGYDGYFPGRLVHPNWEWEDVLAGYGASANGLILNENALRLTLYPTQVGQPLRVEWQDPSQARFWRVENTSRTVAVGQPSTADIGRDWGQPILQVFGTLAADYGADRFAIAITQPGQHFMQQFRQQLQQVGVNSVSPQLVSGLPSDLSEIAAVQSPPLSQWLPVVNQRSQNLYAEALLKALGQTAAAPVEDATVQGTAVVQAVLKNLGIESAYQMADGSGLSRHNLVTPQTLVDVLQAMARHPHGDIYRRSLAVAGQQGTLRRRFLDTLAQGRLQGKTGYLSNNRSLAGYLQPAGHPPVVFSILINNSPASARATRQLIDAVVLELAQLHACP